MKSKVLDKRRKTNRGDDKISEITIKIGTLVNEPIIATMTAGTINIANEPFSELISLFVSIMIP